MHWLYNEQDFDLSYQDILRYQYYGFVYLIVNLTNNRKYVGEKAFHSMRKGRKYESDWKIYIGSNADLQRDIIQMGLSKFRRQIVSIHNLPVDMDYHEVREMFLRDVLHATLPDGTSEYYNNSIPSISFKRPK